jgi:hypothetical protein
MVFDLHHTWVPIAWVITSWQAYEDLVEWLIPSQAKLVANISYYKPLCFIMDDAPQELQHYNGFYFTFGFCVHFHQLGFT